MPGALGTVTDALGSWCTGNAPVAVPKRCLMRWDAPGTVLGRMPGGGELRWLLVQVNGRNSITFLNECTGY